MMDSWSITGTTWSPRCTASFNNIADTTVDRFIEACTLVLFTTGSITVRMEIELLNAEYHYQKVFL